MVSNYSSDQVRHARFHDLPDFLNKGDVLVINTSRTRNSALTATRADGTPLELHLSTHLTQDLWTVEIRSIQSDGKSKHFEEAKPGEVLRLPGEVTALLQGPYISDCDPKLLQPSQTVWLAVISLPNPADDYLRQFGFPIRYNYVKQQWPLSFYQTVYATTSGSAEMPSAGRPFTIELLNHLESKGIQVAPLILHTGISNLENHEPPYKEFYQVTGKTALMVNKARAFSRSRHSRLVFFKAA